MKNTEIKELYHKLITQHGLPPPQAKEIIREINRILKKHDRCKVESINPGDFPAAKKGNDP